MFAKLEDVFNMETDPKPVNTLEVIDQSGSVVTPTPNDTVTVDYNHSRHNLYQLLEKGQEALIHALEVAKQSEHPRAFEVVGNLVKQLADVNHQLMDLAEKKQKLQEPSKNKPDANPTNVTNNAFFVGSTQELNKMISNMSKGE